MDLLRHIRGKRRDAQLERGAGSYLHILLRDLSIDEGDLRQDKVDFVLHL